MAHRPRRAPPRSHRGLRIVVSAIDCAVAYQPMIAPKSCSLVNYKRKFQQPRRYAAPDLKSSSAAIDDVR